MDIAKDIFRIRKELQTYRTQVYTKVGAVGLRYIDDNFRAQGYRASTLVPWKATVSGKGKLINGKRSMGILIKTGRLRRSFRSNSPGAGLVRWSTDVPYAKAHNLGFSGTVNVKAHVRKFKGGDKIGFFAKKQNNKSTLLDTQKVATGISFVKAHTMKMNIPRRQFMPTADRPSEIFTKKIWGKINSDVNRILKNR